MGFENLSGLLDHYHLWPDACEERDELRGASSCARNEVSFAEKPTPDLRENIINGQWSKSSTD